VALYDHGLQELVDLFAAHEGEIDEVEAIASDVPMGSRGSGKDVDPISLPLVPSSGPMRRIAARRDLHLAWNGGANPYSVQITTGGPNGAEIARAEAVGAPP
jgi:hypothetical protein